MKKTCEFQGLTKKEVDKLRKKGEIKSDKKLGDILRSLDQFTIDQYNECYTYICIWCGEFIEDKDNICYHNMDLYHLKCMSKVHETEKEMRDY